MPPLLIVDLDNIDLASPIAGPAEIEATNPQRGQMRQLDAILWRNPEGSLAVGAKDVTDDEFWVTGHIPGRPLLPGILMIEAAAQLAAWMMRQRKPDAGFVGFVGCDEAKFRGQVVPGQRLYILGQELQFKPRRVICYAQGVVDRTLVFEAKITGMPI